MNLGGEYFTERELKDVGFRSIGLNVKIHSRASIYCLENISLGNNIRIDDFTVIIATGRVDICDHVAISAHCYLGCTHGLTLSNFVTLAPGVMIFTASDDYSGKKMTNPTVPREFTGGDSGKVVLEKHVIVGAGSVILPGCTIGEGSSIGACSLVKKSLPPWGVYCGIPVKHLSSRSKDVLDLECQLKNREVSHIDTRS